MKMLFVLHCKMNGITDMNVVHALCEHKEFAPAIMHHKESDIHMTAVPSTPSTEFGKIPVSGPDSCLMSFHM